MNCKLSSEWSKETIISGTLKNDYIDKNLFAFKIEKVILTSINNLLNHKKTYQRIANCYYRK